MVSPDISGHAQVKDDAQEWTGMRIPGGYAAVNPRFGVPLRDGNPDVRWD
jgi:hypothetical protein